MVCIYIIDTLIFLVFKIKWMYAPLDINSTKLRNSRLDLVFHFYPQFDQCHPVHHTPQWSLWPSAVWGWSIWWWTVTGRSRCVGTSPGPSTSPQWSPSAPPLSPTSLYWTTCHCPFLPRKEVPRRRTAMTPRRTTRRGWRGGSVSDRVNVHTGRSGPCWLSLSLCEKIFNIFNIYRTQK